MTEEQIRKPYYDDKSLAELQKDIQTVPADGDGRAVAVHYNEMFVRSTVLKLINDILTLQQKNKQLIEALEEIKDEEWRLAGEFTTIYTTAYLAIQQIQGNDEE